ncbi:hypothetical protein LX32DRAFT_656119 [Colletotrichum zoysiae]|uniref:Uncharacterized protein n=1 Tax=Colletotrichum zoysiae TaxID=1216348 RepID=A0AAD9LXC1_9PEZI|nr:hypothetical protein LX32DRAFT_656119 [Colletotrichum zoysiae]
MATTEHSCLQGFGLQRLPASSFAGTFIVFVVVVVVVVAAAAAAEFSSSDLAGICFLKLCQRQIDRSVLRVKTYAVAKNAVLEILPGTRTLNPCFAKRGGRTLLRPGAEYDDVKGGVSAPEGISEVLKTRAVDDHQLLKSDDRMSGLGIGSVDVKQREVVYW